MISIDHKLFILQCSVSFYRHEMLKTRNPHKTLEIHMRLGQLNRDIDRILAQ